MKYFYKILKGFIVIADIFILVIFGILIISTMFSNKYDDLFIIIPLFFVFVVFFVFIEFVLIKYYGKIVISVEFSGEDVILITNTKRHILPAKYVTEVEEITSLARTYIKYNDGVTKKKFVFQMMYFPFRIHHLNIQEMKKHMPYTMFKG
ncbi:MAG: hypothetical protein J1E41_00130 [Ruminococcus sp.]|nr:hypothetical protein [Ruminococcus sp.]